MVHLAEIALLEGDQALARRTWEQAYAIAPFNRFVVDFRERVESPNPDFQVPERLMPAVGDQSAGAHYIQWIRSHGTAQVRVLAD
jgi:hypothetical protein